MDKANKKMRSGFIGAMWRGGGAGVTATFYWGAREPPRENYEIGVLKSAFQCILSNHGFVLLLKKSIFTKKNIQVMYCVS